MIDLENGDRAYQFFLEEVPELLEILETGLLTLQQNYDPATINDLMRAAHSLKGGAAIVGLNAIEIIAHRLETIFRALYVETEIDTELETLLLEAYDCLRSPLDQQITIGSFDSESALATAEFILAQIETRLADAVQKTDSYIPSSTDFGIDLVSHLFEADIAEGIEHLAEVVDSPQRYELVTEVRAQAEVFIGFAEMLSLPGFGAIATETIAAIDARPEAAYTIAIVALADFRTGREQVLAGDRTCGGSPSPALLAFSQVVEDITTSSLVEKTNPETEAVIEPELNIVANSNSSNLVLVQSDSSLVVAQSSPNQTEKDQINGHTRLKPPANPKIRVDSHRLETINNFVGELVIHRNSQIFQQEQLQTILSKLQNRLEQFQRLTYQFQEISDQISVTPSSTSLTNVSSGDFDALEMDCYGQVYSLIQGIIEETMQLEEAVDDIILFKTQSDNTIKQQQKVLSRLRDELMWARMLPLNQVLASFPRGIRDLSVKHQKPVKLTMSGTEVLIEKGILEKLHDPLLHIIRNAFHHGIEPPEVRLQQGKPESGQIDICAYHQGSRTLIEIKDDGRGLDLDKIARKAIERGWLSIKQLAEIEEKKLIDLIFTPGFSTAEQVCPLSGRGVGLDVVRAQLEAIQGTVTVNSTPGKGTTFVLSLPLTQTIAPMLICSVDGSAVAIPTANVQEVILPKPDTINRLQNRRMLSWREQLLPVYRLKDLLEYRYSAPIRSLERLNLPNVADSERQASSSNKTLPLLIISQAQQHFALETEGLEKEQELVIKPLTGAIKTPDYIYGCTVLGDGSLIPAIAPTALLAYVQAQKSFKTANQNNLVTLTTAKEQFVPTVLAVDDSAMMRRILTSTLEKVGYRVLTAKDGWEALELLKLYPEVQLIVSDLEMPNLNGLELLHQLCQDTQLAQIPFVMLTSRSSDKHRSLAMSLGASAYLTKPYIEQEFLAELQQIIGNCQQDHGVKGSPLLLQPLNTFAA